MRRRGGGVARRALAAGGLVLAALAPAVSRGSEARADAPEDAAGDVPVPGPGAASAERGGRASRIPASDDASEYWDVVALFDSGHRFFARFMITHEGPGENTAIAYGHLVDPDGRARFFSNGRQEGRWRLGAEGRFLDVGSSSLDLRPPAIAVGVHKRRKGVDIDLRIEPDAAPAWSRAEQPGEPRVDLLAANAPVSGSAWFRDMEEPVALVGRAGVTHTWMDRSEPEIALRRLDFFSLGGDTAVYLRDFQGADGVQSRWLSIRRGGETLFEGADWSLTPTGVSEAQEDADYPVPATLTLRGRNLSGQVQLGSGVLHHDPMTVMPQPFRFLLSLKMRPHRVWAESVFEVTLASGSESATIRGPGIAAVTFLNPIPPTTSMFSPPISGD